ncbi:MAG: hypothetical protein V2A55_01625 [Candidatus Jorgensenbacteria bacterium]
MLEITSQTKTREQFVAETIPVGFPWRLFIFSFTLFVFTIFVFFGLKFGYTAYIEKRAENLDRKIENLTQQISQEDQQNFIIFYSQLVNLEKVLNRHGFTANTFGFLEENTLGNVYYSNAQFFSLENSLRLTGIAASNKTLVDQLSLFDGKKEVSRVNLNQMSAAESGGVAFDVTISFKEEFFKNPGL